MKANPITNRVKEKFKSLVQEPLLNVGKVEGGKSDCGCGAKSPAKQTASQTATFGPGGSNPNPKLYAGIVKNAKKKGKASMVKQTDPPAKPQPQAKPATDQKPPMPKERTGEKSSTVKNYKKGYYGK